MNKIFNFFKRAYSKKIDASGLAVFRIFYGIVLFFDVLQIYNFRQLIYDKIPYLEPAEIDFGIPLIIWLITILLLISGLFTRQVAIINYLFSLIFIATLDSYEYHMYYIYMGINFLLIFTNISKVGSFDALILKLKYSNTRKTYSPSRNTSVLNYYVLILVGIALVYFDSVFYKFASPLWLNGLGVWLPASVPQITHVEASFILNQKWFVIFLGYLTLLFETIFIFTFFRKEWRIPLLTIGILLHAGIIYMFPIPRFDLGMIALYLLMVPVGYWNRLKSCLVFNKPRLLFYYDEECPLCHRTIIILKYLDFFKAIEFKGLQRFGFNDLRLDIYSKDELLANIYSITRKNKVLIGIDTYIKSFKYIPLLMPVGLFLSIPGFYHLGKEIYNKIASNRYVERCSEENCGFTPSNVPNNTDELKITKSLKLQDLKIIGVLFGISILCLLQLNSITNSAVFRHVKEFVGFRNSDLAVSFQKISLATSSVSKKLFGITQHAVFVDDHFKDYNHTIAVVYLNDGEEVWLPVTNQDGSLGIWQVGPIWAKWGFRINSSNIEQKRLNNGIRDFTAFWGVKNDVDLNSAKFKVFVKYNSTPIGWSENFLKDQLSRPWISGGFVEWKDGEFISHIKDIESLKY